jgi:hypothetical protein
LLRGASDAAYSVLAHLEVSRLTNSRSDTMVADVLYHTIHLIARCAAVTTELGPVWPLGSDERSYTATAAAAVIPLAVPFGEAELIELERYRRSSRQPERWLRHTRRTGALATCSEWMAESMCEGANHSRSSQASLMVAELACRSLNVTLMCELYPSVRLAYQLPQATP